MSILKETQLPVATVSPRTAVLDAVRLMQRRRIGSVLVEDNGTLIGIFTERDVMLRVVAPQKDPRSTPVDEVMSSPVETVTQDVTVDAALRLMLDRHIRHLPVVNSEGRLEGIVSMRGVLQQKVSDLTTELDSLEAYFTADGIGG